MVAVPKPLQRGERLLLEEMRTITTEVADDELWRLWDAAGAELWRRGFDHEYPPDWLVEEASQSVAMQAKAYTTGPPSRPVSSGPFGPPSRPTSGKPTGR